MAEVGAGTDEGGIWAGEAAMVEWGSPLLAGA